MNSRTVKDNKTPKRKGRRFVCHEGVGNKKAVTLKQQEKINSKIAKLRSKVI